MKAMLARRVDLAKVRRDRLISAAVPTEYNNRNQALIMLSTLEVSERWQDRYRAVARSEHGAGGWPEAIGPRLPGASLKSVQVAYFLALFEAAAGVDVDESDLIVEFGGGFGALAFAILRGLPERGGGSGSSFRGTYVLYDLPLASALQEYILTLAGVVVGPAPPPHQPFRVLCVSAIEDLRDAIAGSEGWSSSPEGAKKPGASSAFLRTFIGLWSFSESPLVVRDAVTPLLAGFDRFFLGYQPRFVSSTKVQRKKLATSLRRQFLEYSNCVIIFFEIRNRCVHGMIISTAPNLHIRSRCLLLIQ